MELIGEQEDVVSRLQLLALGFSHDQAKARVRNGRWQRVHPGVYATFTGPLPDRARIWAAVLHGGPGAAASHTTALRLLGAGDRSGGMNPIEVAVPAERKVVAPPGVRVHRRRDLPKLVHPASSPPRTRLEVALLDVTDRATKPEPVIGAVLTATQRRLTTAERLRAELSARPRHLWRGLLRELLAEVEEGVASPLERRYLREVERAHGLPRGVRNLAEKANGSDTRYRDVRYLPWPLVVELDGRGAHPDDEKFRDWERDNALTLALENSLRYGWSDVVAHPCEIADQVAQMLRALGWGGHPVPCGPACALRDRGSSGVLLVPELPRPRGQGLGARTAAS